MTEKPSMTFELMERSITGWQSKTFPPAHPLSLAAHLLSECVELARSVGMSEDAICTEVGRSVAKPVKDSPEKELGDVVHLVIGMARALDSDVVGVTLPVYQSNRGRAWGAPDPVTGVVEHVEDEDETTDLRCVLPSAIEGRPGSLLVRVARIVRTALELDALIVDDFPPDEVFAFGCDGVVVELKTVTEDDGSILGIAVCAFRRRAEGVRQALALFIVHDPASYTLDDIRAHLRVDTWRKVSA